MFTSGFTCELDAEIDAWPSAVSGFHFIEARLFGAHRADAIAATDALIFHLTDLRLKVRDTRPDGSGHARGAAKLAYEIGEQRPMVASRASAAPRSTTCATTSTASTLPTSWCSPRRSARDPALAQALRTTITELRSQLQAASLAAVDGDQVRRTSEELVLSFQRAAPALDSTGHRSRIWRALIAPAGSPASTAPSATIPRVPPWPAGPGRHLDQYFAFRRLGRGSRKLTSPGRSARLPRPLADGEFEGRRHESSPFMAP